MTEEYETQDMAWYDYGIKATKITVSLRFLFVWAPDSKSCNFSKSECESKYPNSDTSCANSCPWI